MEIQKFLENFTLQFEETSALKFTPETKFRDIEEWSSFHALSIIAMADERYNIKLTGEDIRNSLTISDLFEIVKSRIG